MSELIEVKIVNAEIATIRLEPGDVVLAKCNAPLKPEQVRAVQKFLQPYFPKNKVLAHGNDAEISVAKADQQGSDVLRYCPKCGDDNVGTTTDVSLLTGEPTSAWCGECGWKGSGSELAVAPTFDAILWRVRRTEEWIRDAQWRA
jgi:hypothetical protein